MNVYLPLIENYTDYRYSSYLDQVKKHVFGRLGKLSYLININQVKRVIIKLEKVKFICEWNAQQTMDIDM